MSRAVALPPSGVTVPFTASWCAELVRPGLAAEGSPAADAFSVHQRLSGHVWDITAYPTQSGGKGQSAGESGDRPIKKPVFPAARIARTGGAKQGSGGAYLLVGGRVRRPEAREPAAVFRASLSPSAYPAPAFQAEGARRLRMPSLRRCRHRVDTDGARTGKAAMREPRAPGLRSSEARAPTL